jgi:hypothetical protein
MIKKISGGAKIGSCGLQLHGRKFAVGKVTDKKSIYAADSRVEDIVVVPFIM